MFCITGCGGGDEDRKGDQAEQAGARASLGPARLGVASALKTGAYESATEDFIAGVREHRDDLDDDELRAEIDHVIDLFQFECAACVEALERERERLD